VTLADHGEALGEYGAWQHGGGLHPPVTKIPLVVSAPGPNPDDRTPNADGAGRATRDALVDLLDVYATVLDLAGIESDHRRGVSFRPLLSSDPIATEPRTNALLEYHGISKRRALALEEDGYDIAPVDRERHGIATADCYYFEGPFGTELLGDCDPAVLESDLEGLIADLETRDGLGEADLSGSNHNSRIWGICDCRLSTAMSDATSVSLGARRSRRRPRSSRWPRSGSSERSSSLERSDRPDSAATTSSFRW